MKWKRIFEQASGVSRYFYLTINVIIPLNRWKAIVKIAWQSRACKRALRLVRHSKAIITSCKLALKNQTVFAMSRLRWNLERWFATNKDLNSIESDTPWLLSKKVKKISFYCLSNSQFFIFFCDFNWGLFHFFLQWIFLSMKKTILVRKPRRRLHPARYFKFVDFFLLA